MKSGTGKTSLYLQEVEQWLSGVWLEINKGILKVVRMF